MYLLKKKKNMYLKTQVSMTFAGFILVYFGDVLVDWSFEIYVYSTIKYNIKWELN